MPQIILNERQLSQSATLPLQQILINAKKCQPPRTPFSHNTYHQLILSFEYCKVFRTAQNTSRSSHLQMFFKIDVLKSFANFTGKHSCLESLFRKTCKACNFILLQKRLQHRCFPVKFMKFLKIPFLQNTSGDCFCTSSGCFCIFFKK